jgi:hypothetical protein
VLGSGCRSGTITARTTTACLNVQLLCALSMGFPVLFLCFLKTDSTSRVYSSCRSIPARAFWSHCLTSPFPCVPSLSTVKHRGLIRLTLVVGRWRRHGDSRRPSRTTPEGVDVFHVCKLQGFDRRSCQAFEARADQVDTQRIFYARSGWSLVVRRKICSCGAE